jgi:hypothetical protein
MDKILKEVNLPLLVEAGLVGDAFVKSKFGRATGIGSTPWACWIANRVYNWIPSAQTLWISSSLAGDTQNIKLTGLDSNWEIQTEIIALTGQTPKVTTKTWMRLDRVENDSAVNFVGDIYVNMENNHSLGVPADLSKLVAKILFETGLNHNQTLQAIYTIPAGFTGFVISWTDSTGKLEDLDVIPQFREFGKVFRTQTFQALYQNSIQTVSFFPAIPEKTDIQVLVRSPTGSVDANVTFKIMCIPNNML